MFQITTAKITVMTARTNTNSLNILRPEIDWLVSSGIELLFTFWRGKGLSGTWTPRNLHSGSQPRACPAGPKPWPLSCAQGIAQVNAQAGSQFLCHSSWRSMTRFHFRPDGVNVDPKSVHHWFRAGAISSTVLEQLLNQMSPLSLVLGWQLWRRISSQIRQGGESRTASMSAYIVAKSGISPSRALMYSSVW